MKKTLYLILLLVLCICVSSSCSRGDDEPSADILSLDSLIDRRDAMDAYVLARLYQQADGSGALWLMAWGLGSPDQDHQFGFNPGAAYSMAQVAPGVYQFTGKAGPEKDSVRGDRYRYDYLSVKFFHQNGWGGEFGAGALKMAGSTASLLKNTGNFELADGVTLELGATYRMTVDLSKGIENGTIDLVKL